MKNLDQENTNQDPLDFIKKLKPMEAKKSKQQVWEELEGMMERPLPQEAKVKKLSFRTWSVAASFALLVSLSILAFMRFYTQKVETITGKQAFAFLPDGSKVRLNAASSVAYHPFWWSVSREVSLEGEAFFEVKKGEKFTVISKQGETSVLGTSFNIFARDKDYEVTCVTGKVRVSSVMSEEEVVITPKQMAVINESGKLNASLEIDIQKSLDWTADKFIFTHEPLSKVLAEIARRYGVEIENADKLNQSYTGYFNKQEDIEPVLNFVCKPFNIEYKKLPSGAYSIQ
jgi:ferric-dicitrate binding protein FerR (iron transport regulator)